MTMDLHGEPNQPQRNRLQHSVSTGGSDGMVSLADKSIHSSTFLVT